jgi:hypothetical protein
VSKLLHTERFGSRIEKWWMHDDSITVETVEDVKPLLDSNKRQYNDSPERFGKDPMHKVASIPGTVLEEACRVHQISFRELMAQKTDKSVRIWNELLNGREWRAFRTRPGHVNVKAKS